jgi:hypothetical protein
VKIHTEITLRSPFSLRDLDWFLRDAEASGIDRDEPVTAAFYKKEQVISLSVETEVDR